ncbi:DUF6113 family protein [Isoptericola sp. NEAU-Y5]|uniref:DUF6113 family protein n=1 Tax=Isoptericola luteus TaxID=2879484 RepID=A0ABS7ZBJ0_9MICO|nr:DUF6113 family protein [Isoptericola sp. NEAU-Y5]MCA5892397.1 DUF6113 family protein [Isoptericola sp. NEAU-Y5]
MTSTTPARPTSQPPRRLLPVVGRVPLAALLGVTIGVLGTVAHRAEWGDLPVGIVLALAITLSAAVLCRAWAGMSTLLASGVGWVVAVQMLSVEGPGGDVLVPAQTVGLVWTYGGLVLFAVTAFLPRRWFADVAA